MQDDYENKIDILTDEFENRIDSLEDKLDEAEKKIDVLTADLKKEKEERAIEVLTLQENAKNRIFNKYLKDLSASERNAASKIDKDKLHILKKHRAEILKKNNLSITGFYVIFIINKYETMKSKKREITHCTHPYR